MWLCPGGLYVGNVSVFVTMIGPAFSFVSFEHGCLDLTGTCPFIMQMRIRMSIWKHVRVVCMTTSAVAECLWLPSAV